MIVTKVLLKNGRSVSPRQHDYKNQQKQQQQRQPHRYGIFYLSIKQNLPNDIISILQSLHTVEISKCQHLTDVSSLNNIHHLRINYCQGITDVSTLRNVYFLNLFGCHGITSIFSLNDTHRLGIHKCKRITSIYNLPRVKYVVINKCHRLDDVSGLANKKYVSIFDSDIQDVSKLGTVRHLRFIQCQWITNVSTLNTVQKLTLKQCDNITIADVSMWYNVPHLEIDDCLLITKAKIETLQKNHRQKLDFTPPTKRKDYSSDSDSE